MKEREVSETGSDPTPLESRLKLEIQPQPDATTCGPTCLQAVYRYYGLDLSLDRVIQEAGRLPEGGTLSVLLACHALEHGLRATIYTYNLQIFDPTWFGPDEPDLAERLEAQRAFKSSERLTLTTDAYLNFLERGGSIRFQDLTPALIRRYLKRSTPILTGLSATYLYRSAREWGPDDEYDDVRGEPSGHFVVLCGYHKEQRRVLVADPWFPNPIAEGHYYQVSIDRLIGAILLGILTYDANFLILEPSRRAPSTPCPA